MPTYLIYIAMGLVTATLVAGLYVMFKGGSVSRSYSNRLMQMRVLLQFLTIILLGLAVFVFRD